VSDATGPATRVVIALGSNLGARDELLRDAVAALDAVPGVSVVSASTPVSSVALTLDGPDETRPEYLNAVALVDTRLDPLALLDALQVIESDHGRTRDVRWGDRTLDLDIVVFGDLELDTERLTLPHPRAAERAFVLEPWSEIDEEARLGALGRVADLIAALPDRTRPVPGATRLLDRHRASSAPAVRDEGAPA
jgi:2-amino-4-hydroxy-6-hydroxymethyldihydropteridine diphosphokinase